MALCFFSRGLLPFTPNRWVEAWSPKAPGVWAEGKPAGYLAQGAGRARSQPEQRRGQQEVQAGCCGAPSASSAAAAASTASLAWWQPGKHKG